MSLYINIFDINFRRLNREFSTFLFVFFTMSFSFGQSAVNGLWEGHFSYNSIRAIESGNTTLYAASENAIFTLDPLTQEITTLTTINGLSGDYITAIKYSEEYDLLVIGYETGLMEVYNFSSKSVLKVVDILNKVTIPPENRRINDFYQNENLVYIATNYGISIYDLETLEFGDTYYIGSNGAQLQVRQIAVSNNDIYAATNFGLKRASLDNENLIDFQFWTTEFSGDFTALSVIQETLYAVKTDNRLYQLNGSVLDPVLSFSETILDLKPNASNFLIVTPSAVRYYQSDLTLIDTYSPPLEGDVNFTTAHFFNDSMYFGTEASGLLMTSENTQSNYTEVQPDGPLRNSPFSLHYAYENLWVTFGDYDQFFNPSPLRSYGFSYLENDTWTNISYDSLQEVINKPVFNLNAIAVNPVNSNQAFISSFQNGMLDFKKNISIELLDETNSALQSLVLAGSPNYKSIRLSGLKFDSQGSLWSLTSLVEDPLKKYSPDTAQWETYSFNAIIDDPINDELGFGALVIGPDGTKWVGSFSNGVIGFNENGNLIRQIKGEGAANLPTDEISALALDNNNILWIGTFKGLRILYNTSNFFTEDVISTAPIIILEEGLPKELLELQFITAILVDGGNNKWISTLDAGVFYLSSDGQETIYHFTEDNSPLPSNAVLTMAQNQNNGKIYFGTTRGLVAFNAGGSSPSTSLGEAYVYPNPVRPGFNLETDKIKIKNLSENVNLKITDVEGNLVAEAQSNTNLRFKGYNLEIDGGTAFWNGKNLRNRTVASGVYVVLVTDLDNLATKVLKIMLIRQ